MKYVIRLLVSFLIISYSCAEEDESTSGYIRINTTGVTEITENGVVFNASFDQSKIDKIENHGFVWSKGANVSVNSSYIINLGEPTSNVFTSKVGYQLDAGSYIVRAFVTTKDKVNFYGEQIKFISLGSEGPKIVNVTPSVLKLCDSLTIDGRNFIEKIKPGVQINGEQYTGITYQPKKNRIKVYINKILPVKNKIEVSFNEYKTIETVNLNQNPITVTSFTTNPLNPGDSFTVQLNEFPECIRNNVYLVPMERCTTCGSGRSSINLELKQVTYTLAKSCLPNKLSFGLFAFDSLLYVSPQLPVKSFEITDITPSVIKLGEPFAINGNYLKSDNSSIQLTTGNNIYYPEFSSNTKLIFRIQPWASIVNDGTINAKLETCDLKLDLKLKVALPTITSVSPTTLVTGNEIITVTGENFYPGFQSITICDAPVSIEIINSSETEFKFRILDFANITCSEKRIKISFQSYSVESSETLTLNLINGFKQVDYFPQSSRMNSLGFSIGNLGYVALGETNNLVLRELWQYNPTNNTWARKKDFPGQPRYNGTAFVIKNKAYVGLGIDLNLNPLNDFWEYDPSTDSWQEIAGFPNSGGLAISFSLNDRGYVGRSTNDFTTNELFEYNQEMNKWSKKNDLPARLENTTNNIFFQSNTKGYYFANGQLFNYDPTLDQWDFQETCSTEFKQGFYSLFGDKLFRFSSSDVVSFSLNDINCAYDSFALKPAFSYGITGFKINNKLYIGIGLGDNRFWEFDASKFQ